MEGRGGRRTAMKENRPVRLTHTPLAISSVLKAVPILSLDAKSSLRFPRRQKPTPISASPSQVSEARLASVGQDRLK
jgi:hypothetical protein